MVAVEPSHDDADKSAAGEAKKPPPPTLTLKKKNPWLIDPRTRRGGKFMGYLDLTTTLALIFTASVTPFEVAYLPAPEVWYDALFLVNRIVDAVFIFDMAIAFMLMAEIKKEEHGTFRVIWLEEPGPIAMNYLRSWFLVDLISILVSGVDIISVTGGGALPALKVLRTIRAARLIKMVRLIRANRIIKRWETSVEINYNYISIGASIALLVMMGHWMSCIWVLQARLGDVETSWLGDDKYCISDDPENRCSNIDPWAIYAASLYWAFATITSIGYGDISASPYNPGEQGVGTLLMLMSALFWGYIIATFCGVISNMDPATTNFRNQMDQLNHFMRLNSFPSEMRVRLRQYFHHNFHLMRDEEHKSLVKRLSPQLQREVVQTAYSNWLLKVPFLEGASKAMICEFAWYLEPRLYAPREVVPPGPLYIIHRGLATCGNQILTLGQCWGDDLVLELLPGGRKVAAALRRYKPAFAVHFLEAFKIESDFCLETINHYKGERKRIRKRAVGLALTRAVIAAAKEHRRELAAAKAGNKAWKKVRQAAMQVGVVSNLWGDSKMSEEEIGSAVRLSASTRADTGGSQAAVAQLQQDVTALTHKVDTMLRLMTQQSHPHKQQASSDISEVQAIEI